MNPTRILVADGLTVFRAAVRNVLAREKDFEVVEASCLGDVREEIFGNGCVDIALVDLDLPPAGALRTVELLRKMCSSDVIVWSFRPDQETVFAAIRAGACGYLPKDISPSGLVRSLRGAAQGEAPLSRELMALTIGAIHSLEERHRAREQAMLLSPREREVLDHVALGARNKQIASALAISEFTVKRHVQNILHKLGLPTRRELAAFWARAAAEREQEAVPL